MRAKLLTNEDGEVSGVVVTLSRRNLVSLLYMLAKGRLTGALTARDNNMEILVQGQVDKDHYTDRAAGTMSWERTGD